MDRFEKKRRKTAFLGIVFSLSVLLVSSLYLQDQKEKTASAQVFHEKEVLMLPQIEHEEETVVLPMNIHAKQILSYYSSEKSEAELLDAVTEYQGVYRPSQSIGYGFDGRSFEVTAMVSGVVSDVYEDELMGKCVQVDCGYGVMITYQSLSSTALEKGNQVVQNQVIGYAGENRYHADLGIHAQITVHKDGHLMDPEELIDRKLSEIR